MNELFSPAGSISQVICNFFIFRETLRKFSNNFLQLCFVSSIFRLLPLNLLEFSSHTAFVYNASSGCLFSTSFSQILTSGMKGHWKLIHWLKLAHSFLHVVSTLFHPIILSLFKKFYILDCKSIFRNPLLKVLGLLSTNFEN